MQLSRLAEYLDEYLRVAETPDSPGALNGLQLENEGEVTRVAAAVDASEATVRAALRAECDLLLVHHGLFWSGNLPLTGRRYRRIRPLMENGVAVYSAHIPLDVHPEVGNNAVLIRKLDIEPEGRFGMRDGIALGVWGSTDIEREELAERLRAVLSGPVKLIGGGSARVRRLGVITGAAGSMIGEAIAAGLDGYVTGEGAHHTYFDAMEGGVNVFYGGHYATETWGVRALARHLEERFGLPWVFLDLPTGL